MRTRVLDIVLATSLIVIFWPVMVITAIHIASVSNGPVIFRQERVGRYGRPFIMFKFRNMHVGVPVWPMVTGPDDWRLIPGAVLIRSLFIDELPQLWNVIRGDMSLVGPRPAPTDLARHLEQTVPGYTERYAVRPGMTGLQQLWGRLKQIDKGPLACSRIDNYYVRRRTTCLDLLIMIKTLPLVWRRGGV